MGNVPSLRHRRVSRKRVLNARSADGSIAMWGAIDRAAATLPPVPPCIW